ncbi:MAG: SDR family NAD(P)-dependent oxidoreductase [bacterium]
MNKTVLITGASSGIGMEFSRLFASEGYDLILVARRENILKELSRELIKGYKIRVSILSVDLSLETAAEDIFEEIKDRGLSVDILINNAGLSIYGGFSKTDLEDELNLIKVNMISLTKLTKLAVREMLKKGSGKILNIGSTASFGPGPLNAIYCASKAYVLSFSEAIAKELEDTDISVTTLCPGATETEFAENAGITETRLFKSSTMSAKKVVRVGYKAMLRGKRIVIPGLYNKILIFSIRFIPRLMVLNISKRLMSK